MVFTQRMVTVIPSHTAPHFRMWTRHSTLQEGEPVNLPLQPNPDFTMRACKRAPTVRVDQRSDGFFGVGVLTDVTNAF
ncbi:hypothetical protein AWB75_04146 [Caballeronia catudaia]|uniref:Uncharacterized protein n=1 Tax=Caballeronia catudaia TaxID=1777136 RepID=A0A158BWH1_9BURK|nr:hypothetical protein [Caballeronia catudaia]SAK74442.1 hypothetical protein AWB75_04146 [Caballeronia catudaia]